jgi:hypothetical protein
VAAVQYRQRPVSRIIGFYFNIKYMGQTAQKQFSPLQNEEMITSCADVSSLKIVYQPETSMNEGISKFVIWDKNFYHVT